MQDNILRNRAERRYAQFSKQHPGNNRKNTKGRYHQHLAPNPKKNFAGGIIRHTAAHTTGGGRTLTW